MKSGPKATFPLHRDHSLSDSERHAATLPVHQRSSSRTPSQLWLLPCVRTAGGFDRRHEIRAIVSEHHGCRTTCVRNKLPQLGTGDPPDRRFAKVVAHLHFNHSHSIDSPPTRPCTDTRTAPTLVALTMLTCKDVVWSLKHLAGHRCSPKWASSPVRPISCGWLRSLFHRTGLDRTNVVQDG